MPDYSTHIIRDFPMWVHCEKCGWDSGGINYPVSSTKKLKDIPCPKCGENGLKKNFYVR